MGKAESQILNQSAQKPLALCTDDVFSICNINKEEVTQFIEQANSHHLTINFTAEVSSSAKASIRWLGGYCPFVEKIFTRVL